MKSLSIETLPPQFRKHVDPAAPAPLRMMAARGMVPLSPPDMLSALALLQNDPDESVRASAAKTAATLPDRLLSAAIKAEGSLTPEVLDYFADALVDKEDFQKDIVLNADTPDATIARIAARASDAVLEVIAQNQLRILREESIVRALVTNPKARAVTTDSVTDFCVRNGMLLEDLEIFRVARIRIHGDTPPPEEEKASAVLADHAEALLDESPPTMDDANKLNLTQRVMKMNVSEKIKLATLGNKEARTILLRDSNKLVCLAAVKSPRITEGEIIALSNSRTAHDDVLRTIYNDRDWTKGYQVKCNLVNNPKVPVAIGLKFLNHIRTSELKTLLRNKNISPAMVAAARKMMQAREASGAKGGEG